MTVKWVSCVLLGIVLAILGGCRTPQPDLRPEKTAEKLVDPPQDRRYDLAAYPKQAFDTPDDPSKRAMDSKTPGVMPTRGSSLPGTMGGSSGRGY